MYKKFNSKGFTMIEVVVASSIMMIVVFAMANNFVNGMKQASRLETKLSMMGLENQILSTFVQNGSICTCNLNPAAPVAGEKTTFDSNVIDRSEYLQINRIRTSCDAGAPSFIEKGANRDLDLNLDIESIQLLNLEPTGGAGGMWKGELVIMPSQKKGAVSPAVVPIVFQVDTTAGTGNASVGFCSTDPNLSSMASGDGAVFNLGPKTEVADPGAIRQAPADCFVEIKGRGGILGGEGCGSSVTTLSVADNATDLEDKSGPYQSCSRDSCTVYGATVLQHQQVFVPKGTFYTAGRPECMKMSEQCQQ